MFVNLADDAKLLATGKTTCINLWPFIRELPVNIACVRDGVPDTMVAAKNLLGQLADDERHYQQLFLKQCRLAGLKGDDLSDHAWSEPTVELCRSMSLMCRQSTCEDGIYAIVAAEFAATLFSRSALPSYEKYFERHVAEYERLVIEEGLDWLRLHAKTHTRHAIWMKRMLGDIDDRSGDEIPPAAELILNGVLQWWQCPHEGNRSIQPALEMR